MVNVQEFYINDFVGILNGLKKKLIKENCIKRFIKKKLHNVLKC